MDRINGAGHIGRMFVAEDASIGRPPTEITEVWLNGVQEELVGVIEGIGWVANSGDNGQLFKALRVLFRNLMGMNSAAGGTPDAITATYSPVISGVVDGMEIRVRYTASNATTTPTFTPNSGVVPAKTIVKGNNTPLAINDIPLHAMLKWDAALDKWVLANPLIPPRTATISSDPAFTSNSAAPASTEWIRGAMSNIMTALGFACFIGANGYVKFPSCLGGWVFQWGSCGLGSATADVYFNFPIVFPTAVYFVGLQTGYGAGTGQVTYNSGAAYTLGQGVFRASQSGQGTGFIAIGK